MWELLFDGSQFYNVVLLRDHISNINVIKLYLRENYSNIILLVSAATMFMLNTYIVIFCYFLIIIIRAICNVKKNIFHILLRAVYFISRDILLCFALLFFWPKEKKDIRYNKLDNNYKI